MPSDKEMINNVIDICIQICKGSRQRQTGIKSLIIN